MNSVESRLEHSEDQAQIKKRQLIRLITAYGLKRLPAPGRELSSGILSRDFVDLGLAFSKWQNLELASNLLLNQVTEQFGNQWSAVGGPAFGADPIAIAMASLTNKNWFSIHSDSLKNKNFNKTIKGTSLDEDSRVLVVEDVITTGNSVLRAVDSILKTKATIIGVVAVVNRGQRTAEKMADCGLPYFSLIDYCDLNIKPITL
ncbi:MAG: phosphoribosyltransferase family protein [Candidatus Saccharibacteria bacterium]|nr:phosphoribosyltransferase family protein [Candidatus Saccharibacteria bacterium]